VRPRLTGGVHLGQISGIEHPAAARHD
jgi:hypothetical protein